MTTWAVSLVRVSSLAVVAGRSGLDWDVAVPTVALVTVEAPAVERTVLVPVSGRVPGEGTGRQELPQDPLCCMESLHRDVE